MKKYNQLSVIISTPSPPNKKLTLCSNNTDDVEYLSLWGEGGLLGGGDSSGFTIRFGKTRPYVAKLGGPHRNSAFSH